MWGLLLFFLIFMAVVILSVMQTIRRASYLAEDASYLMGKT
jgi:hypothetical protein